MDVKTRFKTKLLALFTSLTLLVGIVIFIIVSFLGQQALMSQINDSMDNYAKVSDRIISEEYPGAWSIQGNNLYKGIAQLNYNTTFINKIKESTGTFCTVYLNDHVVSSYLMKDGKVISNDTIDPAVAESVLTNKTEFKGIATIAGKKYISRFEPIPDASGKIIGTWAIGMDYNAVQKQMLYISVYIAAAILAVDIAAAFVINVFVNNLVKNQVIILRSNR